MIEYLENNGFTEEQIRKLQPAFAATAEKTTIQDIIDRIEFTYRIFNYAGLSKNLINELISKNRSILTRKKEEVAVIAYVWSETGILDEAVQGSKWLNCDSIMRVYLRDLYLKSNMMQREHGVSTYALTSNDNDFIKSFSPDYKKSHFVPSFANLVSIYGKGETYEEKKENINERLDVYSKRWFLYKTIKEREKRKNEERVSTNNRSI